MASQVTRSETEQMLVNQSQPRGVQRNRSGQRPLADASDQLANRHLVATALGQLTHEHQDVLRECYFRGISVEQAAQALQIAPDLVKSRTYYALHALRLAIEELGGLQ